jgi:glycosyltransferase involved in cell wall biosynthesis
MEPLVSILIPAFNAERWISETIESALAQTWPRTEIIIVDDGSSDRTLAVAQRFASSRVSVLTQGNQGAAAARNRAYSACKGDYIQWLDADDLLSPGKIATQIQVALQCGNKRNLLSSAWGRFFYRPAKARFVQSSLWCDLAPLEWAIRQMEQNLFMQPANWLVSRVLTDVAGPWNTRLTNNDDGEYFCRVVLASNRVLFVPDAPVYYRALGGGSLSHIGLSNKKLESMFLAMQMQIGHIRALGDTDRIRNACLTYLQNDMASFYPERPDIVEEARKLAAQLGGLLEDPRLPWKYAWLQKTCGWAVAKRVRLRYNTLRSIIQRTWDKTLFHLGRWRCLRRGESVTSG